jgi:3-hydroxyisobutyrate dehydrogenase-like beta-hydroxyacid dehydrogenase
MIGLGAMGRSVAVNIRRAGFELTVHDIRPEACAPLAERGAEVAADPAGVLERCDAVVTMVFGPKEIERVLRGPNGLLSTARRGKYWIDLTTSRPRLMSDLAAQFQAEGGRAMSAPVTGSVDSAIRGDMLMFVGGEDADVEAVHRCSRPSVTSGASEPIRTVTSPKLTNNQLWKIHAAAIGEAMVAAKLAGLEPDVWWRAMQGGAADSFVMRHDFRRFSPATTTPRFPSRYT